MVSKRQFSKKDGIVLVSSLVVLLLISVCAFIDDYVKRTEYIPAYSTPEKAIEETLELKIDKMQYKDSIATVEYCWYWYLEEIPKGYTVEINGETVYTK